MHVSGRQEERAGGDVVLLDERGPRAVAARVVEGREGHAQIIREAVGADEERDGVAVDAADDADGGIPCELGHDADERALAVLHDEAPALQLRRGHVLDGIGVEPRACAVDLLQRVQDLERGLLVLRRLRLDQHCRQQEQTREHDESAHGHLRGAGPTTARRLASRRAA